LVLQCACPMLAASPDQTDPHCLPRRIDEVLMGRDFVDSTGVKLSLATARIRLHRGCLSLGQHIGRVWHASRRLFTRDGNVP